MDAGVRTGWVLAWGVGRGAWDLNTSLWIPVKLETNPILRDNFWGLILKIQQNPLSIEVDRETLNMIWSTQINFSSKNA